MNSFIYGWVVESLTIHQCFANGNNVQAPQNHTKPGYFPALVGLFKKIAVSVLYRWQDTVRKGEKK